MNMLKYLENIEDHAEDDEHDRFKASSALQEEHPSEVCSSAGISIKSTTVVKVLYKEVSEVSCVERMAWSAKRTSKQLLLKSAVMFKERASNSVSVWARCGLGLQRIRLLTSCFIATLSLPQEPNNKPTTEGQQIYPTQKESWWASTPKSFKHHGFVGDLRPSAIFRMSTPSATSSERRFQAQADPQATNRRTRGNPK